MKKIAQIIAQNNTVQGKMVSNQPICREKNKHDKKNNQSEDGISALWEQKVTKKYTPEYVKNQVYLLHGNAIKKIKKINKETKLTKAIW